MNHLPTGLATSFAALMLLGGAIFVAVTPTAEAADGPAAIRFGMESGSISAQTNAGVKPDYGTFWIGPWTLTSGWAGPDNQLATMKAAGVTPAIHFYYWGDDISPSCVENGCWSSLHNAQKTRAGWETLGTQLTTHLTSKMGGAPVVIFLESEFNKGGIETYEPFDGYMAAMAAKIHAAYPSAIVVIGFGNWGSVYWGNFDRTVAQSDMVGIQGMRGSTRQSKTDMMTLYDGLLAGVKTLNAKFPGKAVMLTDIAVSSYPEPEYLTVQRDVLKEVFDNLGTLKSLGVEAMVYRSWNDSPNMDTANWYGMAERYWGLASSAATKPSAQVWIDGVKAERAGSTPAPSSTTAPTSSGAYSATVTPSASSNEWWIQVGVSGAPAKVETKVGSGSFVAMDKQSYGWTKSLHAPAGTMVQFRVTSAAGQVATTPAQAWLVDMAAKTATSPASSTTGTATSASTTTAPSASAVLVTPVGNEWWVQAGVSSAKAVAKAEAKAGSGPWVLLDQQSYGWTKSFNVPSGTPLQFRLTAADGHVATTAAQAWLVDMSAKSATWTAPAATSTSTTPPPTTSASATSTAPPTSTAPTTTSTTATPTTPPVTATATSSTTAPPTTTSTAPPTTSSTPSSTAPAAPPAFKASFKPKAVGNDWWMETEVVANEPLAKVDAKMKGGGWIPLALTPIGTYATSVHIPDGTHVTFRATSQDGDTSTSARIVWT